MNRLFKQICGKILFASAESCEKLSEVKLSFSLLIVGSNCHEVVVSHDIRTVPLAVHPLIDDFILRGGPSSSHIKGDILCE